jgi:hypothetical protein
MRTLLAAAVLLVPTRAPDELGKALLFHAGFDGKAEADFGSGDRALYHGLGTPLRDTKAGLPETVEIVKGAGKYGDALRFSKKIKPVVFYKAEGHVAWTAEDFQGTVSFWMQLDPEKDLEPGFCDPIQLTDKKWDDACFFVDFDKGGDPRLFRLGVFPNLKEWNPKGVKWDLFPEAERPWVVVKRHPFARGKWVHVCFTWERFNGGRDDAVARLYLDGALQGELKGKKTYGWDLSKAAIVLGMNYVGLFDDLAVFGRPLSAEEVVALGRLEGGVRRLHAEK